MKKSKKLFYSIQELCERYQIKPSTLHYWEKVFPMLKPKRTQKGNRIYTEEDILLLDMIYFLVKVKGYTLKGAREKLEEEKDKIKQKAFVFHTLLKIKVFLIKLLHAIENQSKPNEKSIPHHSQGNN
ncbi:MAG: MerR family transcriptional regulator [Bacteroidales bacterium]|nr:MerR family transcriptional regulator [Bacteroidales bacterium]